ncbi:hypothetical protein HELRODRAFT_178816 [Helobdella robusta]|uniref:Serpin domain-containing protein n=1 Tax=Helobdella robusta TaxID=6412 RepID=T1FDS4_HELRO|nr:hypothetical protein HELRODRAFT_178816 [Helobdella robusta]ESN95901.1 hypothetical protein HELRODRAFT_178816 [Helobdella robusta]
MAEVGFGLDVYNELSLSQPNANVFFSPLSLMLVLAMTLLGSKDKTACELKKVLHLDQLQDDAIHQNMKLFHKKLWNTENKHTLNIANKIFLEKSENLSASFNQLCLLLYASRVKLVDFKNNASRCESSVNNWVQLKTNNKIKDLISPGTFNALTKIVLVNALYFKGSWSKSFYKRSTFYENFVISSQQTVSVPFMHMYSKILRYVCDQELQSQIIELPFTGNAASFIVILPDLSITTLSEVENKLNADILINISTKLSNKLVNLKMPKFKLETRPQIKEILEKLGVSDLFRPGSADLSGVNGAKNLHISDVKQKAFIEVDEHGVEAAAATAVLGGLFRNPETPVQVNVDHPFVFLIKDMSTGAILFWGKIVNLR